MSAVFFGGWFVRGLSRQETGCKSSPLRLGGFQFIKPLLVCDTNPQKDYPELKSLEKKIVDIIDEEKKANNITAISVYFQDFKTDGRIDVNKDERFNSASIGKVAIMLALYRLAESNPNFFSEKIRYGGGIDTNSGQAIQPKDYAKGGQAYTVDELIEKMIKYSDNNSMYLLVSLITAPMIKSLYEDLQISLPFDMEHPESFDFITTRDISYFFRILYNSSYLTRDLSEKALALLSKTDYKNGLVAGMPEGVVVAHKFGLKSTEGGVNAMELQLHDCGIIYHPESPYLLCVMTKSSSDIPDIESTIKNISAAVYQYQDNH